MKVKLPARPVDGYRIEYWVPSDYGMPSRMVAEYHVRTPFSVWARANGSHTGEGVEILDDWMLHGQDAGGRVCGWRAIVAFLGSDGHCGPACASRGGAVQVSLARAERDLAAARERLENAEARVRQLRSELGKEAE